ncbi:MAG: septum site-determining protein MinD [Clostridia bacterium]|nr:septum site-determining protein MinD [Clostridia bacterium]
MSAEIFIVTSGKGGSGKSTAAVNLSAALAKRNQKVLLIDGDIGLRNLDLFLGMESEGVFHLLDVANGNCTCKEAVVSDRRFPCLDLLLAPQTAEKSALTPTMIKELCENVKEEYDYIFLDAPAGTETGFSNLCAAATRAVVLTTLDVLSVRNTDKIITALENAGIRKQELLINRVRPDLIQSGVQEKIEEVMDELGIPLIGIVPEDDEAPGAVHAGKPLILHSKSRAGQAFTNIAHRMLGDDVPLMELYEKRKWLGKKR